MTEPQDTHPRPPSPRHKWAMKLLGLKEEGIESGIRRRIVNAGFAPNEHTSMAIRVLAGAAVDPRPTLWIDERTEVSAVRAFAKRCCDFSLKERLNRKSALSDAMADLNVRTERFPHLRARLDEIQTALDADLTDLHQDPAKPTAYGIAAWDLKLRILGPKERAERWQQMIQIASLDRIGWASCARQLQFSKYAAQARDQSQLGTRFIDEIAQLDSAQHAYAVAAKKRRNKLRLSKANRGETLPIKPVLFLAIFVGSIFIFIDRASDRPRRPNRQSPYVPPVTMHDFPMPHLPKMNQEELTASFATIILLGRIPDLERQITDGTATEESRYELAQVYLLCAQQPQVDIDAAAAPRTFLDPPDYDKQELQRKALSVLKDLAHDYPDNEKYIRQCVVTCLIVGNATDDVDEARQTFQTGIDAALPLAEAGHASSETLSILGALLNNLTLKLDRDEAANEFQEHLESAVRFQRQAVRMDPQNDTALRYLDINLHNLSHALLKNGLAEDAVNVLLEHRALCGASTMPYGTNARRLFTISERLAVADELLLEQAGPIDAPSYADDLRREIFRTLNFAVISGFTDSKLMTSSVSLKHLQADDRFGELLELVNSTNEKLIRTQVTDSTAEGVENLETNLPLKAHNAGKVQP
ncbi:hypothetical protein CA54_58590 [Symmachiella macrocystis]|uniref:Uncharacterized protein n=1 Tax=Symmachiella macrocystis TaxID=2527985 RepID=A0A5C6B0R9_9PLAN|nr:hypothetical protein [Symmachiella macrocystis]TWU05171.1 hypothetical protein CA54_58590 [Symmachiella macrocystis]